MSSSTPSAPGGSDPARASRRGRLALLGLFALFFVPILLAYTLNVLVPDWRPFGSTNRGQLVEPARLLAADGLHPLDGRPLEPEPFTGKWTVLTVHADRCGDPCAKARKRMHQSWLAMGRDADRVNRVLVVPADSAGVDVAGTLAGDPGIRILGAPAAWAEALRQDGGDTEPGAVYLVDPQGYFILRYPPELADDAMLKDMKRLLRLSQIG